MNRSVLYALVSLFLGVLVAVLSYFVLPQCHADHWMSCNYLVQVTGFLGIAMTFLSLMMIFIRKPQMLAGMQLGIATFGVTVSCMAGAVIRACGSPMMHCHSTTEPVLMGLGIVVAFWGVLASWLSVRH